MTRLEIYDAKDAAEKAQQDADDAQEYANQIADLIDNGGDAGDTDDDDDTDAGDATIEDGIAAYEDGTFDPDNFVIASGMAVSFSLSTMAGLEDDAIVENADAILAEFFGD